MSSQACMPWHRAVLRELSRRHGHDRLPHAVLLHGPQGSGKLVLAQALASLMLCEAPLEDGACGACRACRLWEHRSHTDYMALSPLAVGKVLPVDSVREGCHFLESSARISRGRVVLIAPAEAMNISASNALLKTLEEPPANAHLVLVSSLPSLLPATLRSRCEKLALSAPDHAVALNWLVSLGHTEADSKDALQLAGGAPLLAARWIEDGELEHRRAWRHHLQELLAGEADPVVVAERWLPGKQDAPGRLQELLACLQRWATEDLRHDARAGGDLADMQPRFRLLERLSAARAALQSGSNPNPQLMLEDLLLEWADAE